MYLPTVNSAQPYSSWVLSFFAKVIFSCSGLSILEEKSKLSITCVAMYLIYEKVPVLVVFCELDQKVDRLCAGK